MDDKRYQAVRDAMVAAAIEGSEAGLLSGLDLQAHIFLAALEAAMGPTPAPPPDEKSEVSHD
jgi:hypothetical protein